MKLLDLLEKEDKRKIQLIQMLEESSNLESLHSRLQERLELSDFIYQKTLDDLQTDLQGYHLADVLSIETGEFTISLKEAGQVTSELLLREYVKDAIGYQILKEVLTGDLENLKDFALAHYVGYKLAYNRLKSLKDFLEPYGIQLDRRSRLQGDEQTIRMVLTAVFAVIQQGDTSLLPAVWRQQVLGFIEVLAQLPELTLSQQQKNVLAHYLTVCYYRGPEVSVATPWSPQDQALLQKISQQVPQIFQVVHHFLQAYLKGEYQESYSYELILYLIGSGSLVLRKNFWGELPAGAINEVSQQFVNRAAKTLTLSDNTKQALYGRAVPLHVVLRLFPLQSYLISDRIDMEFFYSSYPEFFRLAQLFILDHQHQQDVPIWQHKIYLFYGYFFLLLDTIPLKEIVPAITVCVDFSLGAAYNRYLADSMRFFTGLNLKIVNQLDDQVDLLLTDMPLLTEKQVNKILWLSPPRPHDWEKLAQQLIQIRDQKNTGSVMK